MTLKLSFWEHGKHILIENENSDLFMRNEALNPLVNWLNLNKEEIEKDKGFARGIDKINEHKYILANGTLMIVNLNRCGDYVWMIHNDINELKQKLNGYREVLGIHEVI